MRTLAYSILLLVFIISCGKEPILNIREGMTFNPDSIMLDTALKGWELYSWHSGENWRYSLLPGTNRVKSANEIYANDYAVKGRDQLKLIIRRLPAGEEITWLGEEWTKANVSNIAFDFEMPSLLTQYDINEFCELQSLTLEIVP